MSSSCNTDGIHVYPQYIDKPCMNAFRSIERTIAFDVKDWAADRRSAWIYAIVFGWDEDESWNELYEKFGWDESDRKRAEKLHAQWENAKQAKWTRVEDKLPEEPSDYLAIINGHVESVMFHYARRWMRYTAKGLIVDDNVTHWMPMPELPEGVMRFG